MKTKIRCQRCGYSWETKSQHIYVSCPNCMTKVMNRKIGNHFPSVKLRRKKKG